MVVPGDVVVVVVGGCVNLVFVVGAMVEVVDFGVGSKSKMVWNISRGGGRNKPLNQVSGLAVKVTFQQQSTGRRMFWVCRWWEPYRHGRTEEE